MHKLLAILLVCALAGPAWADFDRGLLAYRSGNYEQAFEEFHESAIAGHATAQFNVGVMYYRGEGTERDMIKAYGWIELATDQPGARDLIQAQEVLAVMLSAEEVAAGLNAADRLARLHGLSYRGSARDNADHTRVANH